MSVLLFSPKASFLLYFVLFFLALDSCSGKKPSKTTALEEVLDVKEFKKLLKTRTSVLVCFAKSAKDSATLYRTLNEVADLVKGTGTIAFVDCGGEARKLCKNLKLKPERYLLKHYKEGEFHKDYDRKETVQSLVSFMKEPTGDAPWEEDDAGKDVVHLPSPQALAKLTRHKDSKGVMVMFYAPWCGFCKKMKPDYAAAATALKGHSVVAAIDVNRPENSPARRQYNITGFPTLLYFQNGELKFTYEGDNTKDAIVEFMKNPAPPSAEKAKKSEETPWSEEPSKVLHLTTETFDTELAKQPSALVMFYAPWCGYCKKIKPDYVSAAEKWAATGGSGVLAAVDATKEQTLGSKFGVKGYPTIKYFKNGEFAFDVPSVRDESGLLNFMKNPAEPPPPPPPEAAWSEQISDVVHLNDDYRAVLKKKKHALVMFYAPWCGHCKKAKPEFTSAAAELAEDPQVALCAVDCTVYPNVCKEYDVKGYPTLMYFSYLKKAKPYESGRTSDDFVSFIRQQSNSKQEL